MHILLTFFFFMYDNVHSCICLNVRVQVMERLCVRLQQQVCVLKGCEEGEEVQTARQILKEARDSRAVSRLLLYLICKDCTKQCVAQAVLCLVSCLFCFITHVNQR